MDFKESGQVIVPGISRVHWVVHNGYQICLFDAVYTKEIFDVIPSIISRIMQRTGPVFKTIILLNLKIFTLAGMNNWLIFLQHKIVFLYVIYCKYCCTGIIKTYVGRSWYRFTWCDLCCLNVYAVFYFTTLIKDKIWYKERTQVN